MHSVRETENCSACGQPLGLEQEMAELRAEVAGLKRLSANVLGITPKVAPPALKAVREGD